MLVACPPQALFTSKVCLEEINTAMKSHVTVIPVLFESAAHVKDPERWTPLVTKSSPFEEKNWLREAKPWYGEGLRGLGGWLAGRASSRVH